MTISTDRQREILEGMRTGAEEDAFQHRTQKRAHEQLLARATASKLRLGQYTSKATKDGPANMGNAPAAIKQKLAQLEYDIERLEVVVADIDEQLAALPVDEEPETEE